MSLRSMEPSSRFDFIVRQIKNHIETLEAGFGERLLRNAQESIQLLSIELGDTLSEPEFRDPPAPRDPLPPPVRRDLSIEFDTPPPVRRRELSIELDTPILTMEDLAEEDDDLDEDYVVDDNEILVENLCRKLKPKLKLKRQSKKATEDDASCECVICFEKHSINDQVVYDCGHKFCGECTIGALRGACINSPYEVNHKCPMCRNNVSCVTINYNIARGTRGEVLKSSYVAGFKRYCKI